MKRIKRISSLFILAIIIHFAGGCEKSSFINDCESFFLKNEGAVLPIWVRGNLNSGIIIITVHGGPGGTSQGFVLSDGFKSLEKDYGVLYWDQRFSGLAGGNPDKSTLTIDQFVDDLSNVVILAKHKYPDHKFFILGHSWGGGLSAAFLGKNDNQSSFRGWIDVDGSVRDDIEEQAIKNWILERVPMNYSKDPEFWQFIIDWYRDHPVPLYSDEEPYLYVSALGGDAVAKVKYPVAGLIFHSPFTLALYINKVDPKMCDGIDFTPQLNRITIPSLILWGKQDGILPDTLAHYTNDQLGTPEKDKQIIKIPGSAHSPHYDNPSEFSRSVKEFIEKYRSD